MASINAYEGLDILVMDFPNIFLHTNILAKKDGEERVIIKITGDLVDMLVELHSKTYRKHVVFENGRRGVYFVALK